MRCDRYRWNCTALGFTNQLTARGRIALGKSNTCKVKPLFSTVKVLDTQLGGARGGQAGRADLVHLGRYIAEAWSPIMCAWAAWDGTGRIPYPVWNKQGPAARIGPAYVRTRLRFDRALYRAFLIS